MRRLLVRAATVALLAASNLAAQAASAEWVDWIAEADVTARYDSNLNNAPFSRETERDWTWIPRARLGRVYQLPGTTRLSLLAEARGDVHHRESKLDAVTGSGEVALSHKFGVGDAPWGRIFFRGGYEEVQDHERSGMRLETGAQVGKRFSPRFDASLGYRYTRKDGSSGNWVMGNLDTDVWDQHYHEVDVDGRFLVTDRLLATLGFGFRHGDLVANSQSRLMKVLRKADVEAVVWDKAFGGWAYRLDGESYAPFASLNYAISDRWSLDAGYRFLYAESDSLDYVNHSGQLTVLFRY